MPRPHNTQRHNVVLPLLHNHERSAQRVLAHVLHALQPHADQFGRHALHVVVLLLHEAGTPSLSIHSLGAARDCREMPHVWRIQMCGTTATLTPSRISAPFTHPHTERCHGEKMSAAQRIHEGTRTHGRKERNWAHQSPLCFFSPSPTDCNYATQRVVTD
ncbi:hypothetical protein TcG_11010 [Trypanosoma cruzi]|nr:hypothetical protein TcG_11010 [Trypanosoma cruzi]